ncbi:hypothetical protein H4Q26_016368 [Puccinia striiformis f. sp. tritici PST-130]|nr:hypothetical protein H4Q26_016368 [Puccinia striiformis f. sp. tritici PST-130]
MPPASDSSCSNLLKHAARCINKQREVATNQKLVDLGVSGTGDIDPREVPQLCAIWCAEAARPFSALADQSHKNILHPTVVKNLPSSKVVSRSIHMLYTAVQDSYREVLKSILSPYGTLKKKKATGNRTNDDLDPSDNSEEDEEEAVTQICRYKDDTGLSEEEEEHTSEDHKAEESGKEEAELTLNNCEDLSDKDEENDL